LSRDWHGSAVTLDRHDLDWPVHYEETASYYARVEKMVGVAGTVHNRPSYFCSM